MASSESPPSLDEDSLTPADERVLPGVSHPEQTVNQDLQSELSNLRKQYNEAMVYVQQMDSLHPKNSELTKANRALIAERDEVNPRLQFSFQMNDEIKAKLNAATQVPLSNLNDLKQKFDELRCDRDRLASQIHELETQVSTQSTEKSELELTIQKLLDAGKVRFGMTFATPAALQNYLLRSVPDPPQQPPPILKSPPKS
jgi:uncharacterized protein (DUF3084 family)